MKVKLADKYGFCFGVKRAIKIAEKQGSGTTFGPLIHNPKEIDRLKRDFNVSMTAKIGDIPKNANVIIRTHGIEKHDKERLAKDGITFTDATCPFVIRLQKIVEDMSNEGYGIIIFGDKEHPEIKGAKSYALEDAIVVSSVEDFDNIPLKKKKVALISQTTKQIAKYMQIANHLITTCSEVRVFNTICNATFDNQDAIQKLSKEVDIMIVVGGLVSANTKQLLLLSEQNCKDSYLIEDENGLKKEWFIGKTLCGLTAGASTPDWIIENVKNAIEAI